MGNEKKRIEEIYHLALEKKNKKERSAYLDSACGDDSKLRTAVEGLLEAHDKAGNFLEVPPFDPDVTLDSTPLTEGPGTTIGNYKLLEQIGEGGMAVVYMAEQKKPIRRRVALKIIKLGMDTKQVIARFEVERQALAVMDHPNIAKVLDAGTTETGRPYFVMELVRGVSISTYCDKNKLDTKERLDLFVQVCNAVQHAHQKGIIHRDIKPTNVMVTLRDGKPVPKVIDFGIAKATSHRLTEKTLFTRYAQMIGTPAYMSPEQAEFSELDIDTRTDIYSLGVLLYELLTGVTPFSEEQLREAGYLEMQRIIREEEPVKPSTKLSTLGDTVTDIAEHRKTDPDMLRKLIMGDLDWIVMKALEKSRTRRYDTTAELSADIFRHLNNEPVLAVAPSVSYRMHKFIRRNRTLVISSVVVLIVLVAGIVTSTIFAIGQARARSEAVTATDLAKSEEAEAIKAREKAERSEVVARRHLVRLQVEKGVQLMDEGDLFGSLLYFAEALNLDQGNPEDEIIHRIRIAAVLMKCPKLVQVWFEKKDPKFSPDGCKVLMISDANTARVWDIWTGIPVIPPITHDGPIQCVSFSSNGRFVATASADGTARVWDANTGEPITPPLEHDDTVYHASFSPDGHYILTASSDGTARIWYTSTGQPITEHLKDIYSMSHASFGLDGNRLVTVNGAISKKTTKVKLWDVGTGKVVAPPWKKEASVIFASFSPDGQILVATSSDGTARVWDATTGELLTHLQDEFYEISSASWSPDGNSVVTYGRNLDNSYEAVIWDLDSGKPILKSLQGEVLFRPDGRPVEVKRGFQLLRISDAATGDIFCPDLVHGDYYALSSDGLRLITAGMETVCVWDLSYGGGAVLTMMHEDSVEHTSFSPDGKKILTASLDGTARIWDVATGKMIIPPMTHNEGVNHASFSPDGQMVVTLGKGTARIWDVATGKMIIPPIIHDHPEGHISVSFNPDGRRILTTNNYKNFIDNENGTVAIPYDAEGHLLRGDFGIFEIFDVSTGDKMSSPFILGGINHASFSPDGQMVVTTGLRTVKVWDITNNVHIDTPLGKPIEFNRGRIQHAVFR